MTPSRIPRSNPARKAREWARAYGSKERVAFVQSLPCVVLGCTRGPIENMHIRGDGAGRKADAKYIVPACSYHHAEAHSVGIKTFEALHQIPLAWHAAQVEFRWQDREGLTHISEILPGVLEQVRQERRAEQDPPPPQAA